MKIKCSLDIGAWFDIISVYNVKINSCPKEASEKNKVNFQNLEKEISECIGAAKFKEIIDSDFYKELYQTNLDIFKLVDKVKEEPGIAKDMDALNYKRYIVKSGLQENFFGSKMSEIKIGY